MHKLTNGNSGVRNRFHLRQNDNHIILYDYSHISCEWVYKESLFFTLPEITVVLLARTSSIRSIIAHAHHRTFFPCTAFSLSEISSYNKNFVRVQRFFQGIVSFNISKGNLDIPRTTLVRTIQTYLCLCPFVYKIRNV